MTKQEAIKKLIFIAQNEIGYLEKRNGYKLYDKTANAGNNNYTKYWDELYPQFQGSAWCAIFVTWCFVQAFGKDKATQLLKHYPYTYCPTMVNLFKLNSNPNIGDVVIFYRGGEFVHTGIVTKVNGDYFETIEGNTSGGSSVIANGGGVCRKSYYNSNLPGTKFCTPDWSIVASNNTENIYDAYFNKLVSANIISNKEIWSNYNSYVKKSEAIALLDKLSGGTWYSEEANSSVHWVQPYVISMCGKGVISDKEIWLNNPDADISKAQVLALVDKMSNGTLPQYQNRSTDHWGRNYLDSLCDKGIISTPHAWDDDFEATVSRGNFMALVCKAFNF